MGREAIRKDAGKLQRTGSRVRCVDDGDVVVVILEPYQVPVAGVYEPAVFDALAFRVPATYPDASPDVTGFYVKAPGLRVAASGAALHAAAAQTPMLGEPWTKLSWAPRGPQWDSDVDDLQSHLAMIERRFTTGR